MLNEYITPSCRIYGFVSYDLPPRGWHWETRNDVCWTVRDEPDPGDYPTEDDTSDEDDDLRNKCLECRGTGIADLRHGGGDCAACSGSGKVW